MLRSSRRQTLLICLFLVLVVVFMTTFRMGIVSGASMQPTYHDGQVVLVRRLQAFGRSLRRGDVVLVRNENDVIIKRVFRIAGEELDLSFPDVLRPTLRRNLGDYYEQKSVKSTTHTGFETHYFVPQGYLVVVGDNTTNSEDSRVFGPVSIKDVLGVVVMSPPAPYATGKAGGDPNGIYAPAADGSAGNYNRFGQSNDRGTGGQPAANPTGSANQ